MNDKVTTVKSEIYNAFLTLVKKQDELNSKISPKWKFDGNDWALAIIGEASELNDHIGWKWWMKQDADLPQARIEAVDILHFGISMTLENVITHYRRKCIEMDNERLHDYVAGWMEETWTQPHSDPDVEIFKSVKLLVNSATSYIHSSFDLASLKNIFVLLAPDGLEEDLDILNWVAGMYLGKNVLNSFRQDHGYKEGTYIKNWDGDEDNVYLDKILCDIADEEMRVPDMSDEIYSRLSAFYEHLN